MQNFRIKSNFSIANIFFLNLKISFINRKQIFNNKKYFFQSKFEKMKKNFKLFQKNPPQKRSYNQLTDGLDS